MEFNDEELKTIADMLERLYRVSFLDKKEYHILEEIEEHLLEKRMD